MDMRADCSKTACKSRRKRIIRNFRGDIDRLWQKFGDNAPVHEILLLLLVRQQLYRERGAIQISQRFVLRWGDCSRRVVSAFRRMRRDVTNAGCSEKERTALLSGFTHWAAKRQARRDYAEFREEKRMQRRAASPGEAPP
ncbi:MAG TPA: hypothetical protein VMV50_00815 [Candidatus Paceibacterota bacterium]|nr:hypothetical protein [Candidatus Paceibacterota bacterium]